MLTFHPRLLRDGYGRFIEKFSDVDRDWNDLEDELVRTVSAGPARRRRRSDGGDRRGHPQAGCLGGTLADLSLDAAEPLAASLEHSAGGPCRADVGPGRADGAVAAAGWRRNSFATFA